MVPFNYQGLYEQGSTVRMHDWWVILTAGGGEMLGAEGSLVVKTEILGTPRVVDVRLMRTVQ